MTNTVCSVPRCPAYAVHRGKCARHRQTTTERGYGVAHQSVRAQLALTLPRPCGYGCGTTLTPSSRWVAAHRVDGHPEFGYIVACGRCNERAKHGTDRPVIETGRRGGLLTRAPVRTPIAADETDREPRLTVIG